MKVFKGCAGVVLYNQKNNSIYFGERADSQGWSFFGGKQEEGETLTETAVRETFEECGVNITVSDLHAVGTAASIAKIRQVNSLVMTAIYYACVGGSKDDVVLKSNGEMKDFKEVKLDDLQFFIDNYKLFGPTKASLTLFIDKIS